MLGLANDVYLPSSELGCQARVLSALAYGQGELVVRHYDFDRVIALVDDRLGDLRRIERARHENRWVQVPRDNVDLLARQFANDGLDPRALDSHTGPDRVNPLVV